MPLPVFPGCSPTGSLSEPDGSVQACAIGTKCEANKITLVRILGETVFGKISDLIGLQVDDGDGLLDS